MAEGQKKRQIGKGMKVRGNKRVKKYKEAIKVTTQSTDKGQRVPVIEPVLEAEVRNETPGNLEPEKGSELLQNLEQKEAIVAHDDDAKMSEVRFFENPSELEAALNESSGEVIDAEFFEEENYDSKGEKVGQVLGEHDDLETAMAVGTGTVKDLQPPCGGVPMGKRPTIAELEELLNRHGSEGVSLETNGAVKLAIGPQPDGSEKFIITIQEGYTDAVRQWAEVDGVPVEQWLSDRLYEYISTYGEPAKGR